MLEKLGWRQMLLAAALMLFMSGCYTVVSRSAPLERVTSRTATIYETAPGGDAYVSDDRDGEVSDDQYSDDSEEAEEAGDEDGSDLQDDGIFGIRADAYDRSDEDGSDGYQNDAGKTVINNYYEYPVSDYRYSRYGNDLWDWGGTTRFWGPPYLRVGIMYNSWDPFYWHDPWSWGLGFGYNSYYWNDPWYWGGGYAWDPWYRYSWYNNYHHDSWYHGGGGDGGGNGDGGGYERPRLSRPDRLAGFGSGRRTGGVVSAGRTGENATSLNGADGSSIRRGSNGGVESAARRRTSRDDSGVAAEKRTSASTGGNTGVSTRRRAVSGENTGRQVGSSGQIVRRTRVNDDPDNIVDTISRPVRREGDVRYRWKSSGDEQVRREVSSETPGDEAFSSRRAVNSRETVRRRTPARENSDSRSENSSATRGKTTETSRGVARPSDAPAERGGQSAERGRTEVSRPAPSAPERSSGSSSGPSYSPPSGGGSNSGGGSSRGGGSSSGGGSSRGSGGGGGGGGSRRR